MQLTFLLSLLLAPLLHYSSLAQASIILRSDVHISSEMTAWRDGMISTHHKRSTECAQVVELPGLVLCQSYTKRLMNRTFLRASVYIEGGPHEKVHQIPSLRSLRFFADSKIIVGNDLKGADLVDFQREISAKCLKTRKSRYCLNADERELFARVIDPLVKSRKQEQFVIISIYATGNDWKYVLSHELLHAQYFLQNSFNQTVQAFWKNMIPEQDKVSIVNLLKKDYDSRNLDLMINEFQAYALEETEPGDTSGGVIESYQNALLSRLRESGIQPLEIN